MKLTREEIEQAMPGRSLDRIVAPLAGWTYRRSISRWVEPDGGMAHVDPPNFSGEPAAAWQLVGAMGGTHLLELYQRLKPHGGTYFAATFIGLQQLAGEYGKADTMPLAICRAALLASLAPVVAGGAGEEGEGV